MNLKKVKSWYTIIVDCHLAILQMNWIAIIHHLMLFFKRIKLEIIIKKEGCDRKRKNIASDTNGYPNKDQVVLNCHKFSK